MTTTTRPAVRPGTYRLDPATSEIRFATRHLFGLGAVTGTFGLRDGTAVVAVDPGHSTVHARLDVASFHTGNPRRDNDIRSARFLDAARYPDLAFASTGVTATAAGWTVTGTLGVRDGSGPVSFTVTAVREDGDGYLVTATARVDRRAVGFTTAPGMVGRWYDLTFSVALHP